MIGLGERENKMRILVMLLIGMFLWACAEQDPQLKPNGQLVVDYMDAYNAQDLEEMAEMLHADFQWLNIDEDDLSEIAGGRDQLLEELKGYFASGDLTKGRLSDVSVNGQFVSALETVYYMSDGEEKSQASISVYEIESGKLRRVWYFPAQR